MNDDAKYIEALDYFIESLEPVGVKKAKEKKLRQKVILTFWMTLVADLISSFDFYAVTHDWIITQIFTGLVSQAIWFTTGFFLFDAKERKERITIFVGSALGCSLGSTIMLTWFKPYFNSFF